MTVDGTWQKHGRTSLIGVTVVMSWLTGQVLDVEVLSKHCHACVMKNVDEMDEDEYEEWLATHKAVCDQNYEGSSNAMEVSGVERMWLRSVANLKVRYTTFIGDGDSKAFANLVQIKPYDDGVTLTKHECVGHVQKRLGTALRKLKKSGVVDPDTGRPVKFMGKLTDKAIMYIMVVLSEIARVVWMPW